MTKPERKPSYRPGVKPRWVGKVYVWPKVWTPRTENPNYRKGDSLEDVPMPKTIYTIGRKEKFTPRGSKLLREVKTDVYGSFDRLYQKPDCTYWSHSRDIGSEVIPYGTFSFRFKSVWRDWARHVPEPTAKSFLKMIVKEPKDDDK